MSSEIHDDYRPLKDKAIKLEPPELKPCRVRCAYRLVIEIDLAWQAGLRDRDMMRSALRYAQRTLQECENDGVYWAPLQFYIPPILLYYSCHFA